MKNILLLIFIFLGINAFGGDSLRQTPYSYRHDQASPSKCVLIVKNIVTRVYKFTRDLMYHMLGWDEDILPSDYEVNIARILRQTHGVNLGYKDLWVPLSQLDPQFYTSQDREMLVRIKVARFFQKEQ